MKEWIIPDEFLDDETMLSASAQGYLDELIRCKDCEHWDGYYCHHKGWGDGYAYYTPPIKTEDGFCDWAERKES